MLYLPNVICIFVNYITYECFVFYCTLFSSMFIFYVMYRHQLFLKALYMYMYMYMYVCKSIAHKQLGSHVIDFLGPINIPQNGYLTKYLSNG